MSPLNQPGTLHLTETMADHTDTVNDRFQDQGAGAVLNTNEAGATALPSPVQTNGSVEHQAAAHQAAQDHPMPAQVTDSDKAHTDSAGLVPDAVETSGAVLNSNGSDEPTGSVNTQGTRKKSAGAVKSKGLRRPKSTKSQVARNGSGKSHAVTTKLDAELLRRLTAVRARSGMSESGLLRLALASYLDNLEQRSIAAEISKAAAAITVAGQASTAPVVERLNTLEQRVQQQLGAVVAAINGIREVLGEPVDLTDLDGLNDAGESKGVNS